MKTPILITSGVVAVVALGAWLRWAVTPVVTAFGLGRSLGTMEVTKDQHPARRP